MQKLPIANYSNVYGKSKIKSNLKTPQEIRIVKANHQILARCIECYDYEWKNKSIQPAMQNLSNGKLQHKKGCKFQ